MYSFNMYYCKYGISGTKSWLCYYRFQLRNSRFGHVVFVDCRKLRYVLLRDPVMFKAYKVMLILVNQVAS